MATDNLARYIEYLWRSLFKVIVLWETQSRARFQLW